MHDICLCCFMVNKCRQTSTVMALSFASMCLVLVSAAYTYKNLKESWPQKSEVNSHCAMKILKIFLGLEAVYLFTVQQVLLLYNTKVVLRLNKHQNQSHTWKYSKTAQFPFTYRLQPLSPQIAWLSLSLRRLSRWLRECELGQAGGRGAGVVGAEQIIGWSGSGWKRFRVGVSEASRPAEHNEVTLPETTEYSDWDLQEALIPSLWTTKWQCTTFSSCSVVFSSFTQT